MLQECHLLSEIHKKTSMVSRSPGFESVRFSREFKHSTAHYQSFLKHFFLGHQQVQKESNQSWVLRIFQGVFCYMSIFGPWNVIDWTWNMLKFFSFTTDTIIPRTLGRTFGECFFPWPKVRGFLWPRFGWSKRSRLEEVGTSVSLPSFTLVIPSPLDLPKGAGGVVHPGVDVLKGLIPDARSLLLMAHNFYRIYITLVNVYIYICLLLHMEIYNMHVYIRINQNYKRTANCT